eukprot:IDg6300t1
MNFVTKRDEEVVSDTISRWMEVKVIKTALEDCLNCFPLLAVPKTDSDGQRTGTLPCLDVRLLNSRFPDDDYEILRIQDVIDQTASVKGDGVQLSSIDIVEGFLKGIEINHLKTSVITNWERPRTVAQLLRYLRTAKYYRQFIRYYPTITAPLDAVRKEKGNISWTDKMEQAFENLKKAMSNKTLLALLRSDLQYHISVNASEFKLDHFQIREALLCSEEGTLSDRLGSETLPQLPTRWKFHPLHRPLIAHLPLHAEVSEHYDAAMVRHVDGFKLQHRKHRWKGQHHRRCSESNGRSDVSNSPYRAATLSG